MKSKLQDEIAATKAQIKPNSVNKIKTIPDSFLDRVSGSGDGPIFLKWPKRI